MDLITKSIQLRENPEYSGPIWDLERLETMYEMEQQIAQLTAENERLTRVVEQSNGCASLHVVTIAEENASEFYDGWRNVGKTVIAGIGATEKFIAGYPESEPDLYAQLTGVDRG
jgi:hypothetical protein